MIKEQLETGSHTNNNPVGSTNLASSRLLGEDLQIILPAVKVCHLLEFDSSILVLIVWDLWIYGCFVDFSFPSRCGAIGFCATVPSGIHRLPPGTTTSGMIIFRKYFYSLFGTPHSQTHTHTARVVMNRRPSHLPFFFFIIIYFFDTFFYSNLKSFNINFYLFGWCWVINSPPGTPWTRLATLINLLSRFDTRQVEISNKQLEGNCHVLWWWWRTFLFITSLFIHFFFSCENN